VRHGKNETVDPVLLPSYINPVLLKYKALVVLLRFVLDVHIFTTPAALKGIYPHLLAKPQFNVLKTS
jgi:hypothetical protein